MPTGDRTIGDQRTPLGDLGAKSFLLRIGYQLVALYSDLFNQKQVHSEGV